MSFELAAKTVEKVSTDVGKNNKFNPDKRAEKVDIKNRETVKKFNPDKRMEPSDAQIKRLKNAPPMLDGRYDPVGPLELQKSKFNPDKRAEKLELKHKETGTKFDPDKRVASEFSEKLEKEQIDKMKKDYINDIISNSEYPKTIDKKSALSEHYEKRKSEDTAMKREEFQRQKKQLIDEWEKINGISWPVYKEDVYDEKGHLLRKAGMRYDAHHIHPLGLGGENTAENLTPLSADIHTDHKGVHSYGSPYDKLEKLLGGM